MLLYNYFFFKLWLSLLLSVIKNLIFLCCPKVDEERLHFKVPKRFCRVHHPWNLAIMDLRLLPIIL